MKKPVDLIVFLIILFGFTFGLFFLTFDRYFIDINNLMVSIFFCCVHLLGWSIVYVIFKEFVKLVWGKLSGLKILSFRFLFFEVYLLENSFHLGLSKLNGKFCETKFYNPKKFNIKKKYSFLIVGEILELLVVIALLVLFVLSKKYNYVHNQFLLTGIIVGFLHSFLSLFPLSGGKPNSGALFASLIKNPHTKQAFYIKMSVLKKYTDLVDIESIDVDFDIIDYNSELQVYVALLKYYYLLSNKKSEAFDLILKLYNDSNPSNYLKGIIESEYMFNLVEIKKDIELAKMVYEGLSERFKVFIRNSYLPIFLRLNYTIRTKILDNTYEEIKEDTIYFINNTRYSNVAKFNLDLIGMNKTVD